MIREYRSSMISSVLLPSSASWTADFSTARKNAGRWSSPISSTVLTHDGSIVSASSPSFFFWLCCVHSQMTLPSAQMSCACDSRCFTRWVLPEPALPTMLRLVSLVRQSSGRSPEASLTSRLKSKIGISDSGAAAAASSLSIGSGSGSFFFFFSFSFSSSSMTMSSTSTMPRSSLIPLQILLSADGSFPVISRCNRVIRSASATAARYSWRMRSMRPGAGGATGACRTG
mmetsp:Transcript_405/g.1145  ORF Transcript_405/g.1145 Transcript_405/m.1145 type:complete len:229 (+) Transcript_405:559-1245(+)